ncbi:hypothetical protein PAMP_024448 [Pampus punctatissimus]
MSISGEILQHICLLRSLYCLHLSWPRVDRDTVASGRAPTAPGLGREGIADTAKDVCHCVVVKW